eukprot:8709622-Pyramimonas_sp.AAC.1
MTASTLARGAALISSRLCQTSPRRAWPENFAAGEAGSAPSPSIPDRQGPLQLPKRPRRTR